jgi:branched-chain amino acid transport system permease protein
MKSPGEKKRPLKLDYHYIAMLAVSAVIILLSLLMGENRYSQRIILLVVLWAAMSGGFNLISGYGGQVVFGYMMFVGTGSYATVLLFKFFGMSPWFGMWLGALAAVAIAFFIGLPTLKLRGHYFAVATMAFPLMTFPILNHLGLEEVSIPFAGKGWESLQFGDLRYYVFFSVILLAIVLVLSRKLETSRLGFALRALRHNETAAEGMGINTFKSKLVTFMISSAIGAIGGTFYAFSLLYVLTTHAVFGMFIIVRLLSISIVGGLGTVWGSIIAAVILVPVGELLTAQLGHRLPGVQDLVYGAALVIAIIYLPEGIWGRISNSWARRRERRFPEPDEAAEQASACTPGGGFPIITACETVEHKSFPELDGQVLLRLENVSKSFGGVKALSDLNIAIPTGKLTGIIGPNGSGKTTLFNVINGYLKPEKGAVTFDGTDALPHKPNTLCRMGIGRTFQVAQVFQNMTVLENIMVGAFAKTRDAGLARDIAADVAGKMGIFAKAGVMTRGLNLWETKMVEISRALATQPKLLLLDEPMSGLNPEENEQIGGIIREIANSGVTVVAIEHVVQTLVKISDQMIGLDEGCKLTEGNPQEVISNPDIIEAYLGTKWRERYATN